MTLWLAFVVMLGVALLFVMPPLLRRSAPRGPDPNALNVALHARRLAELQADLAAGTLNEAQFAQARDDLERELLQEYDAGAQQAVPGRGSGRITAIVLAVALPVAALGLYYQLGGWRLSQNAVDVSAPEASQDTAQPAGRNSQPSIDEMVKRLEDKLAGDPNNAQGWTMLGRSYVYLNRYADAVRAYAQAEALTDPPDAQVLAEYAEALALANGDRMSGAPERLAERALQLQPDNPNALWLIGMAAFQKQDFKAAAQHWERLQGMTDPGSEQGRILADYLARAKAGGKDIAGAGAQTPVPVAENTAGAATTPAALRVHVALDPALAAQAAPEDTVFVFARAVQGPPMPLAIVRKQVRDLPLDVTLDDSLAMLPAMKLSNFAAVTVGARVSKSGNATPASGDLQGLSGSLQTRDAGPVSITIDQVIP